LGYKSEEKLQLRERGKEKKKEEEEKRRLNTTDRLKQKCGSIFSGR
jgi:hypothetical protein